MRFAVGISKSKLAAAAAAVLLLGGPLSARAVQPDEILPDAAMEARARAISAELRCLVCQSQSIDDSNAPLAKDLRVLVRERLKVNDSDQQVLDYIVARYGEFILLKPPFRGWTLLLWLTPVFVLAGAAWLVLRSGLVRTATSPGTGDAALTADEKTSLDEVLRKP